jgi:hypothetical protein
LPAELAYDPARRAKSRLWQADCRPKLPFPGDWRQAEPLSVGDRPILAAASENLAGASEDLAGASQIEARDGRIEGRGGSLQGRAETGGSREALQGRIAAGADRGDD